MRPERFELPTPWFVAKYSIQLSYGRMMLTTISKTDRDAVPDKFRYRSGRGAHYREVTPLRQGNADTLKNVAVYPTQLIQYHARRPERWPRGRRRSPAKGV